MVSSCLNFISIFLSKERIKLNDEKTVPYPEKVVVTYIAFSIIWSLGANLHDKSRSLFGGYFKGEIGKHMSDFPDGDVYEFGID